MLAAGTQGAYSRRWSAVHCGYSLQIRPLRLQDSGLYRAWLALQSPPINITRDFTLRVYGEGGGGLTSELYLRGQTRVFSELELSLLAQRSCRSPTSLSAPRSRRMGPVTSP